jgi:hypothetical protein
MTPKNSSPDFFSSSSQIPKPARQLSVPNATTNRNQYITKQRRQHISAVNNDFVYQRTAASLSVPLLIEIMNTFFQTTQSMEDEIMLPSRLKDMPVERKYKIIEIYFYFFYFYRNCFREYSSTG